DASAPTLASDAMRALGSIPGAGRYGGKNSSSTRAQSAYGFALISTGHGASAANSAGTIAHPAVVVRKAPRYLAEATKMIVPGAAASSGAGVLISASPLPRSSRPSRAASSFTFMHTLPSQPRRSSAGVSRNGFRFAAARA